MLQLHLSTPFCAEKTAEVVVCTYYELGSLKQTGNARKTEQANGITLKHSATKYSGGHELTADPKLELFPTDFKDFDHFLSVEHWITGNRNTNLSISKKEHRSPSSNVTLDSNRPTSGRLVPAPYVQRPSSWTSRVVWFGAGNYHDEACYRPTRNPMPNARPNTQLTVQLAQLTGSVGGSLEEFPVDRHGSIR